MHTAVSEVMIPRAKPIERSLPRQVPPPVKPPRQWMEYGDWIRILGTIAVVVGHVSDMTLFDSSFRNQHPPVNLNYDWWIANIYDSIMRWAVPAYIMLSGALLLDPARNESASTFYRKRLLRIGAPLIFWSVFFSWFSVVVTGWVQSDQVWINLLKGQPYMHLHFIFRIAGLYAFTPMLRVFLRHSTRKMLIATVVLLLSLSALDSVANGITGTELSGFARFAPFAGYYLCGYLLRNAVASRRTFWLCVFGLVVSTAVLALGTGALVRHFGMVGYPSKGMILYDFLSPVRVIMALCGWVVMVTLFHHPRPRGERGRAIIRFWANTTLGLYLIHPMFRELLFLKVYHGNWPNVAWGIPLVSLEVYGLALVSTIILMRIPYIRRITG